MPTDGIHLLLSLENLLNLGPTIVRDLVQALIFAPEVYGNLAGPVNLGCKRFGKLVHVIKRRGNGFGLIDFTTLPAI